MSISAVRASTPPPAAPVTPAAGPTSPGQQFDTGAAQQGGSDNTAQNKAFQQLMMQTAQGMQSQMQNSMQETMKGLTGEDDEPEEGDEPL